MYGVVSVLWGCAEVGIGACVYVVFIDINEKICEVYSGTVFQS